MGGIFLVYLLTEEAALWGSQLNGGIQFPAPYRCQAQSLPEA